jgi:hypothetical protein
VQDQDIVRILMLSCCQRSPFSPSKATCKEDKVSVIGCPVYTHQTVLRKMLHSSVVLTVASRGRYDLLLTTLS